MHGVGVLEQAWPGMKTAIETKPPAYPFWHMALTLGLFLGHDDDYRSIRTRLLQHADEIIELQTAERCRHACLLLPASDEETRRAAAMVERVAASNLSRFNANVANYVHITRSLAESRLGHPQRIVELPQGGPSTVLKPLPQLIVAIAQQRLGQGVEARGTLASATAMFDWDRNRAIDTEAWSFHTLRREAEREIGPAPAAARR